MPPRRKREHSDARDRVDSKPSTTTGIDTSAATNQAPLFTCLGYANEGLPLNPRLALFYQNKPDALGFTPNPLGFGYRDLGLGNFLEAAPAPRPTRTRHGYRVRRRPTARCRRRQLAMWR